MSQVEKKVGPYALDRFIDAQARTYDQARAELRAGQKRSHWMWFVFPQIRGLGSSPMAQRFGIADRAEAVAYLEHALLGPRLLECTALVNAVEGRLIEEIFGYPDDLKFHSSMTLFAQAAETLDSGVEVFAKALARFFDGKLDRATLDRLS